MAKMKKCPICSQSMKLENLEKHIKKVHPREKVEIDYTEKEEKALEVHERRQKELTKPAGMWKLAAVIAVIIVLIGAFIILANPQGGGLGVGSEAPNFELDDTSQIPIELEDFRGQIVYLDFFDTDCEACRVNVQTSLVEVYKNYSDKITMLSVDVGFIGQPDTVTDIISFKAEYGAQWTFMLDTKSIAELYYVDRTPHGYLIDRSGIIVYEHVGSDTYDSIASQINKIL